MKNFFGRKCYALSLLPALLLFTASPSAAEIIIHAVGDIMLGGNGSTMLARRGYDYPFAATAKVFRNGDVAIGNLEAPLTNAGTEYRQKRFRFKTNPGVAPALKQAGFSILTLANNHIMDFGIVGLEQTLHHLENAGIAHAGAGMDLSAARRPAIMNIKGKKLAFLAYSLTLPDEFFATRARAGTAPGYLSHIKGDVISARAVADHVIVSFHWGSELASQPRPYQRTLARAAIDAGADVVIGHHPHVLQGIERYKGGVIFYSLGNFAFASSSVGSARSIIARITLDNGIKAVELLPLNVLNREVRLQPALLEHERAGKVIDHLQKISEEMGTIIESDGERYMVNFGRNRRVAAR